MPDVFRSSVHWDSLHDRVVQTEVERGRGDIGLRLSASLSVCPSYKEADTYMLRIFALNTRHIYILIPTPGVPDFTIF